MNNFELDEQARILSDTLTPHALAKRVIELEDINHKLERDWNEQALYADRTGIEYDNLVSALEFQGIDVCDILDVYEKRDAEYAE